MVGRVRDVLQARGAGIDGTLGVTKGAWQQPDGSVRLPAELAKFVGTDVLTAPTAP